MFTLADARTALESIRTLRNLTGAPTPAEAASLARWSGWGPLSPAFDPHVRGGWAEVANDLDDLFLTHPADLMTARDILDTSFYTPAPIVTAVFDLLRATGFTGGRVLEPGCGSGRFMAGTPSDLAIDWTGVEMDPTSAAIAEALNPTANIIASPMQKVTFTTGEFDVAMGNVPFSSARVFDPAYPNTSSLHEYFLMRALDAVRVGGYVIAVTSRFTMDSLSGLAEIGRIADIAGAVRLPSGAFSEDGTEVTTDIVLLRRRAAGATLQGWNDRIHNTIERQGGGHSFYGNQTTTNRLRITEPIAEGRRADPVEVNNYWREHPEHVAGKMVVTGNMHNPLSVIAADPATEVSRAVHAASTQLLPLLPRTGSLDPEEVFSDVDLTDAEGRKTGSFHLVDGTVHVVTGGILVPAARAGAELRMLIGMRDAAVALVEAEGDHSSTDVILDPLRATALTTYEAYVAKHGALNRGNLIEGKEDPETGQPTYSWRRPLMGGFRKDPDYVTVMALEKFNQETGEASPAAILLGRINHPPVPVTRADTPNEALTVTLGEGRGIDLTRIASLLGLDNEAEAVNALGDRLYADPARGGAWTLDRDYLSGNVRQKLGDALEAAATNPALERNVTALQSVHPADLGPLEIRVSLGAPWIEADDVRDFAKEAFGVHHPGIVHTPSVATWEVDTKVHVTPAARITWGTEDKNPMELLDCALNGKAPTVMEEVWSGTSLKKVRNPQATIAAEDKLRTINERFSLWVWEDEERSERICAEYNDRFNSHVARRHDGSYLTFPTMSKNIKLWDHQKNMIDRVISTPRVLCGHVVGSGKTLSMIGSAIALRRFGLARKPLIAVPKHLLEQIAREAQQAFPTSKFLIATEEDLKKENRRLFAARCATGDYDLIVMTHQAFTSLPVDPAVEERWIEEQKSELRGHMQGFGQFDQKSKGAKAIARAVRSLESRLEALRYEVGKDDQVRFDQLGIDYIAVDEAHMFKRLATGTSRSSGFSMGHSKRATDLLLKIETLAQRYPDKPIVGLFTGTPWSNTIAETFVWQKYLQPERLAEAGVAMFDAWAANFVRFESRVEVSPDGATFRIQRRPSVIQNVPELMGMLGEVADILTADDIGLERPDATYENVGVDASDDQLTFVAELAARSERLRSMGKQILDDGRQDNMLLICTDGRKAALDPNLLGMVGDSPKITAAAERIAGIYQSTKDTTYPGMNVPGALQVAFCDYGTPHTGDSQSYGRLRKQLVELGVPADRIRWIHEAKTSKAREAMFAQCRGGAVSVLIGSTETMGMGTNIQQRLIALHHVDAPWRPSDMTQRDGRALRPGNLNSAVDILRYVTIGTFDGFMWQGLERKARFIAQMLDTGSTLREIEDVSDSELTYGEVKALAAGNPMLMEHTELQSEVKRLMTMRSVHQRSVNAARGRADTNRRDSESKRRLAEKIEEGQKMVANSGSWTPSRLASVIDRILGAQKGSSYGPDGHWWGLSLEVERQRDSYYGAKLSMGPEAVLIVKAGYHRIGSLSVRRSKLRNPEKAGAHLIGELQAWWENQIDSIPRLRSQADALDSEALEADQAVAAAVFDGAPKLAAAVAKLESLEAAMAADADAAQREPVAA